MFKLFGKFKRIERKINEKFEGTLNEYKESRTIIGYC
mgnify:CR=1 FL=1